MALPKEVLNAIVLKGSQVGSILPECRLIGYAHQLEEKIRQFPLTMLPQPKENLLISMRAGRSIVCFDDRTGGLLSFGQIWHYKDQHPEWEGSELRESLEFGSWVSLMEDRGFGRRVFSEARELASLIDQNRRLIAIVESQNQKAQQIIIHGGGFLIGHTPSDRIRTEFNREVYMDIYEIPKRP